MNKSYRNYQLCFTLFFSSFLVCSPVVAEGVNYSWGLNSGDTVTWYVKTLSYESDEEDEQEFFDQSILKKGDRITLTYLQDYQGRYDFMPWRWSHYQEFFNLSINNLPIDNDTRSLLVMVLYFVTAGLEFLLPIEVDGEDIWSHLEREFNDLDKEDTDYDITVNNSEKTFKIRLYAESNTDYYEDYVLKEAVWDKSRGVFISAKHEHESRTKQPNSLVDKIKIEIVEEGSFLSYQNSSLILSAVVLVFTFTLSKLKKRKR